MNGLKSAILLAASAAACAPQGADMKIFPASGEKTATLIFNTGEAPAGALDYFAKGLSERGIAVTLASGRAWSAAAAAAMSPDACTQVGGFGEAVTEVAHFADKNFDKGVDNALLVAGRIEAEDAVVRSPVMASAIFAAKDPATPQTYIDKAYEAFPGYSSYTVMNDTSRDDLLGAAADGPRAELIDIAEYEILHRCDKRLDRIEQAAQRKAWDDAQKNAAKPE